MERRQRTLRYLRIGLCIAVVAAGMLWLASALLGNPIARIGMKGRVERYLAAKYPSVQFAVGSTGYGFFDYHEYYTRVTAAGQPEVVFTVIHSRRLEARDDYFCRRTEAEAVAVLTPLVESVVPQAHVSVNVDSDAEASGASDVHFDAALSSSATISVSWSSATDDKPAFVKSVADIMRQLRAQGYRFRSCQFGTQFGDREYGLILDEVREFSEAELAQMVIKPGKW